MQRTFLVIGGTVIAVITAAAILLTLRGEPKVELSPAMMNAAGADIGGPFTLIDQKGASVSDADVIDRPSLIYFGYTFCPDVCPVDVQVMADAVELLAERGIEVRPVFITIDPARDTVAELAVYAEAMHPEMIALTGTDEQIKKAADAYKVFYTREDAADSAAEYLMQHSAFTYLMLPRYGYCGSVPERLSAGADRRGHGTCAGSPGLEPSRSIGSKAWPRHRCSSVRSRPDRPGPPGRGSCRSCQPLQRAVPGQTDRDDWRCI